MISHEQLGTDFEAIANVAPIVADVNTEAKCAALVALPFDGTVRVGEVSEVLRQNGAFDLLERRSSYNLQSIFSNMSDEIVVVRPDIEPGTEQNGNRPLSLVTRASNGIGVLATACAGDLLEYSRTHNRPLRTLLGEKKAAVSDAPPAIEARLDILGIMLEHHEAEDRFTEEEIVALTEPLDITKKQAQKHFLKLARDGIISPINCRSRKHEFAIRPDGKEVAEEVSDLFDTILPYASPDQRTLQEGVDRGTRIIKDHTVLPLLIKRTFANTSHTNKSTARRSKSRN